MSDSPPRAILLVTHFYPPAGEVAAVRPAALARHLRRLGHEVTVVTSSAYGTLPGDQEVDVERTWDLQRLSAGRRGGDDAPGARAGLGAGDVHPLSRVLVPDAHLIAWEPFARARALRLARRGAFDCLITTSPPDSTNFVGPALRRRGIPWVADLRDGWMFESMREEIWLTRAQHRLNARMERRVLGRADLVTAVTTPIAADIERRLGIPARTVPNGWDPDGPAPSREEAAPLLDPDRVSLVYTGQLAGAGRDPGPLVKALAALARAEPAIAGRLELAFAGAFTEGERALFEADVSPARIKVLGPVDRALALGLQAAADGALLVTGPRRQEASAKLFEYLGARLPILALTPADTAAAAIMAELDAGIAASPDRTEEISSALRRFATGEVEPASENAIRAYTWPVLAERMAAAVEEAIAAAAGPG